MNTTERHAELLEQALAGSLSPTEKKEFDELLQANESVKKEWESLQSLQEVTRAMKFKNPPEETWDTYWAGVYARIERGLAWLLVSIGAAVLFAFGLYHWVMAFVADTETPIAIKLAIAAVSLGGAILIVSVLREKLFVRKSDKYREVIR